MYKRWFEMNYLKRENGVWILRVEPKENYYSKF